MTMVAETHELETWRNNTASRVWLKKYNSQGLLVDELIGGGKQFHVTPNERRLNQEKAANVELDVFSNGTFAPVRLIDGEEDAKALADNPNVMSDSSMGDLFKQKGATATFIEKVNAISNPTTLNRLLSVAEERDASVKQVGVIRARLEQVSPLLATEIHSTAGMARATPERKGVTPK